MQNFPVGPDHIWSEIITDPSINPKNKPALFLDRDGVVVEEVHYLSKPEDVRLIDGAPDIIRQAHDLGILIIMVTNQSGVARDYFGWAEFAAVQQEIFRQLAEQGANLFDAVFACPFHKSGKIPFAHENHSDRKPNPGMLMRGYEAFQIDMAQSIIVGDRASDLLAGKNAGLKRGVHVLTGHGKGEGETEKVMALQEDVFSVEQIPSIKDLKL